jgi:hypothetical protein
MSDETPITFTAPCYVLFNVRLNAVMTTAHGNLAAFSTKGMADLWASRSAEPVEVIAVNIRPILPTVLHA